LHYPTLNLLRKTHPGWRLLMADYAPLIASSLDGAFIQPNVRVMSRADLVSKLEVHYFICAKAKKTLFPAVARPTLTIGRKMKKAGCVNFISPQF
jgi:hypothetical protein